MTQARHRSRPRGPWSWTVGGLFVLVAATVGIVVLFAGHEPTQGRIPGTTPAATPATPTTVPQQVPVVPVGAAAVGVYVTSDVLASGQVKVGQWINATHPVDQLAVAVADPGAEGVHQGAVKARRVVVRDSEGTVLARRRKVTSITRVVQLLQPSAHLYLSYRLDGALDRTSSVPGRVLAHVLALEVAYDGAAGPTQHEITAAGTVLNVACLAVGRAPRPCGQPTSTGGWQIELAAGHRDDHLFAQIDLSSR